MEEKFLQEEDPGAEKSSPFRTKRNLNSSSAPKTIAAFDLAKAKGTNLFGKEEKLKSKKIIEQLFKEGKSVSKNGFTLVYLPQVLPVFYPVQAGFSVPKSSFKKAVDRNRIKRLMREAYRLNKIHLYEKLVVQQKQLAMMWVYKGKKLPDYETVLANVLECLKKLKL